MDFLKGAGRGEWGGEGRADGEHVCEMHLLVYLLPVQQKPDQHKLA